MQDGDSNRVFVLTGPTAAGKKEIGLGVARRLGAEVLGLDSVKVYRGLTIGAASPSTDEVEGVRIHLVGVADPTTTFSIGRYLELARAAVDEIAARGRRALFLGGTPLYLQALLRGFFPGPPADAAVRARLVQAAHQDGVESLHARLAGVDPEAARRILPRDLKRITRALEVHELTGRPISDLQRTETRRPIDRPFTVVGLRLEPGALAQRQRERVDRMLASGLVDEVRALLAADRLHGEAAAAIGYREVIEHLRGERSLADARDAIVRSTHQLVRKQMKWFRRFPEIRWIERGPDEPVGALVERVVRAYDSAAPSGTANESP